MLRLIYVSQTDDATYESNKVILTTSFVNNRLNNISGALLYGRGYFIQCLEGSDDLVYSLFSKISYDSRHYNIKIISDRAITERHFEQWHMSLLNLDIYKKLRGDDPFEPFDMDEQTLINLIDEVSKYT